MVRGGKNETLASEYAFQNQTNFALLPLVYLWTPKKKKKSFMAILRYGKGGKNETLASEYAFQNKTNFALLPLVYLWTPK